MEMERSDDNRKIMMNQIHELEFAAVDLNLYLDSFPDNKEALASYNTITNQLKEVKDRYEMLYGPLTNFGYCLSKYPWAWVNDPWPWEIGE